MKYEIFDNTIDQSIVINPTKQQIVFFPKEESQMFTSKTSEYTGATPTEGLSSDSDTESENTDSLAFMQRAQFVSNNDNVPPNAGIIQTDIQLGLYGLSSPYPVDYNNYRFNIPTINSSHTPTDYIGASVMKIPTILSDQYCNFQIYNLTTNVLTPLYSSTDSATKISNIFTGVQTLRMPADVLNTILTDPTAIANNNNSNLIKNFGKYYVVVSPLFVQTTIGTILERKHVEWVSMIDNATSNISTDGEYISLTPISKRRNIYQCDKTNFENLVWEFEQSNGQSGRLYGSIVEIWDSSNSILKQSKIMTENEFNFENSDSMQFVLYPDNVGYDSPSSEPIVGDIVKVYPRESYFDQFSIEVNYKDQTQELQYLLSFMLNDTVRDMNTGIFEIYDEKGFSIDTSGNYSGNVVSRYQVFQNNATEARKRITS